jgi:hypothetical protein
LATRGAALQLYDKLVREGRSNAKAVAGVCSSFPIGERGFYRWLADRAAIERGHGAHRLPSATRSATSLAHKRLLAIEARLSEAGPRPTLGNLMSVVQAVGGDLKSEKALEITTRRILGESSLSLRLPTEKKALPEGVFTLLVGMIGSVRGRLVDHPDAQLVNFDEFALVLEGGGEKVVVEKGTRVVEGGKRDTKTRITVILTTGVGGGAGATVKFPLHFIVAGSPAPKTRSARNKVVVHGENPAVSVQAHAWTDTAVMGEYWAHIRPSLSGRCIITCDEFGPHAALVPLAREPHGAYLGGEVLVGPANVTHVWQPADVGLVKDLKDRYKREVRLYREQYPRAPMDESLAMMLISRAWEEMPEDAVLRYWVRSGLLRPQEPRTEAHHRWVAWDHGVPVAASPDTVAPFYGPHPYFFGKVDPREDPCAGELGAPDDEVSAPHDNDLADIAALDTFHNALVAPIPLPHVARHAKRPREEIGFRMSDSMREWLVASLPPYCHMAIPIIEKRGHVDLSLRPRLFKDKFVGSGLSEPSVTLLVKALKELAPKPKKGARAQPSATPTPTPPAPQALEKMAVGAPQATVPAPGVRMDLALARMGARPLPIPRRGRGRGKSPEDSGATSFGSDDSTSLGSDDSTSSESD